MSTIALYRSGARRIGAILLALSVLITTACSTPPSPPATAAPPAPTSTPVPSLPPVRAVVTYDSLFALPEGDLAYWIDAYAGEYDLPADEFKQIVETLQAVPPGSWRDDGTLSEDARRLASYLPLYYIYEARTDGISPSFLLMYRRPCTGS